MRNKDIFLLLIILFVNMSCDGKKKDAPYMLIETDLGDIKVKLYDETPLHKANFIKLAKEGYYDGTLFHRVIKDFMVQGGDGDSRNASPNKMLGMGGPGYDVPAEIVYPKYYHKRGALAAARQGDEVNPDKKSSGSQFYIVTGKKYSDGQLDSMDVQLQKMQEQTIFNRLALDYRAQIMQLRKNRDQEGLMQLQEELIALMKAEIQEKGKTKLTPEQRDAYKNVGGTPHLDGAYTVFGEIIDGMDVVAKIEAAKTGKADRPKEDIKIKMKWVE